MIMSFISPRLSTGSAITGAVAFLLATAQFFLGQIVTAAAWTRPYSWSANWISDLGNTACGQFAVPHGVAGYVCSPLHTVMNVSFVLNGILFTVGVIALWKLWPQRPLATVANIVLLVSGVLKPVVGLAPENTNVALHLLGALNLPLTSLGILLMSIAIRRTAPAISVTGFVLSIVGLVGTALSSASQYRGPGLTLGLGYGGMERVADYPAFVWMVVVAIAVLIGVSRRHREVAAAAAPTAGSVDVAVGGPR
jgi:hypothetical membrane protein